MGGNGEDMELVHLFSCLVPAGKHAEAEAELSGTRAAQLRLGLRMLASGN